MMPGLKTLRSAAGIAVAIATIMPFTGVANGDISSKAPNYSVDIQVREQIMNMLVQEKSALRDVVLPDAARKQELLAVSDRTAISEGMRVSSASGRQALSVEGEQRSGGLFGLFRARPVRKLNQAYLDQLPEAGGGAEFGCLAEALYFEARGESVVGQMAVAEVILNRKASASYPNTVCAVVRQGAARLNGCQFSYYCDGRKEIVTEKKAYSRVAKVARLMLDGRLPALTDGATHYHATSVRPDWSRKMTRTAAIGDHVFYRMPTKVTSR
jgi:Cell Wall Hydrolase